MKEKILAQLKRIVADSYEATAEHFAETRNKVPAPDFLWAVGKLRADDFVLDVGCGSGRLLGVLPIDTSRYLGIDQSAALLAIARREHVDYRFIAGDLTLAETWPENKYLAVFCSAVINHIPGRTERIKVLRSMLSAAKTGGRLIISYWKLEGKYRNKIWSMRLKRLFGLYAYGWNELVFPWKNNRGDKVALRYYHLFTRNGFKREIREAGWNIKEEYDSRYNYWLVAEKEKE